jgi:hypothetical protein
MCRLFESLAVENDDVNGVDNDRLVVFLKKYVNRDGFFTKSKIVALWTLYLPSISLRFWPYSHDCLGKLLLFSG